MSGLLDFAIGLTDGVSGPAGKAREGLEKLSTELVDAKGKLASYQAQLSRANQLGDVAGHAKYSALVDQSKQSVYGLTQQLEQLAPAAASGAGGLASMAGPIGLVVAGALAGAAAVYKLGEGLGELVVKALEVVGVNERLIATFEALGGAGAGKETLDLVDNLATKLPQSRDQLAQWTQQLQKMGVTDLGQLRTELTTTASAQAVLGAGGDAAYEKINRKVHDAIAAQNGLKISSKELTRTIGTALSGDVAARLGLSLHDLEGKLKAGTVDAQAFGNALTDSLLVKGKGPLAAMGNELGTLGTKAKETINHLFDGIETKPLTDALKGLILLGDQSQPSGQALKSGLGGGLNVVIKLLGSAITEAEVFFLRTEILAYDAYLAVKPLIGAFEKVSGFAKTIGLIGGPAKPEITNEAPSAIENQHGTLAVAGDVGAAASNTLQGNFLGAAKDIALAGYDIIRGLSDDKSRELARQSGVTLGQEVITGIREGTETHSPSRAAMRIGLSLGAGLGEGIEASPAPARAARTVSGNALAGLARGGANDNAATGGAGGANVGSIHVHIDAPAGVTDATALSVMGLSVAFERMGLAVGR